MPREKQVSFPAIQSHRKQFELAMIVICVLCIVAAVLIAKATDWGITTRP